METDLAYIFDIDPESINCTLRNGNNGVHDQPDREYGGINCTLRNGNFHLFIKFKTQFGINCTLRNGNCTRRSQLDHCPCINCTLRNGNRYMDGSLPADYDGINCTLRNGN